MECGFSEYTPLITAFSALLGVVSGGVITYWSSSKIKNIEISGKIKTEAISERKAVYADFLCSVNESATKIIQKKQLDFDVIHTLSSHLARIQILAKEETYIASSKLVESVFELKDGANMNTTDLPTSRKNFVKSVHKEINEIS